MHPANEIRELGLFITLLHFSLPGSCASGVERLSGRNSLLWSTGSSMYRHLISFFAISLNCVDNSVGSKTCALCSQAPSWKLVEDETGRWQGFWKHRGVPGRSDSQLVFVLRIFNRLFTSWKNKYWRRSILVVRGLC